jgi:hypothetical protein
MGELFTGGEEDVELMEWLGSTLDNKW